MAPDFGTNWAEIEGGRRASSAIAMDRDERLFWIQPLVSRQEQQGPEFVQSRPPALPLPASASAAVFPGHMGRCAVTGYIGRRGLASRSGVPVSANWRSNAAGAQRSPYCWCQAWIWR